MNDVLAGRTSQHARAVEDVEKLLDCWWYPLGREGLKVADYVDRGYLAARERARRMRSYQAIVASLRAKGFLAR
jgi:hypothetical protein